MSYINTLPSVGPMSVTWFGARADGSTDNSTAFQRCLDAAVAARRPMHIPGAALEYVLETGLELPTFSATGNTWDEGNPCTIIGDGWNKSKVRYTGSGGYAISHPTINGTTNRGQNAGVEISGFTLTGPQNYSNTATGIGIDNTRRPHIHRMRLAGFAGGNGIHLYGHQKGGTFYGIIENCYFGNQQYQTLGAEPCVDLDELKLWTMRYGVVLDGPADTTGKVNGTLIKGCYFSSLLIGAVQMTGHGSFTTGGCAETRSIGNVYFFGGSRQVEEGVLTGTPTDTIMRLRQTDAIYTSDDDLNDMYLMVVDTDGIWHARYIDDFTGATRSVTLESALPFTPAAGTAYTLGFADAAARVAFPEALCLQHAFYWDSTYAFQSVGDRVEQSRLLVASANATSNVAFVALDRVAQDGRYAMRADGSEWSPRAIAGVYNVGSDAIPAPFQARAVGLWDGSNPTASGKGTLSTAVNDTGDRIATGDVLEYGGTTLDNSSTGNRTHVVVASLSRAFFEDGELATFAVSGEWNVNVSGATARGDLLIPTSVAGDNVADPVSPATATVEQLSRAIGKAIGTTAGAGTVAALIGR